MVGIKAWGGRWTIPDGRIVDALTPEEARAAFDAGRYAACELDLPGSGRTLAMHNPGAGYLLVESHGFPEGTEGRASLIYQRGDAGSYALRQVSLTRHAGDPERTWTQVVHLLGDERKAVLDVPAELVRYTERLRESPVHAEVAALAFPEPAFGDYEAFVRTDLVARCLLDMRVFDPDLPESLGGWVVDRFATPAVPAA